MTGVRDNTTNKAKSTCEQKINELFNIWEEIGIKEETLTIYADQVLNHLDGLLKDMVEESIQKRQDLLNNIKVMAETAIKLSKELGTNFRTDSYDDLPLYQLEIYLTQQVQTLQTKKENRLRYVEELLAKELEICKKLGTKPVGFDCELPTEAEVKKFENHLTVQKKEKHRLAELFKESRESIIKMMEELLISPALDFERMVCNDQNFVYSLNNMTKLQDLRERLRDQVEQAKSQAEEKKEALIALWEYLDEPDELRQKFLNAYQGYNSVTLAALNNEIKRCKEKRSQNIANYVNKVRLEIENLWKLCKYSEVQKKAFTAMKCQTYTEDLLTLHEMEKENLRKFYNSNRKIYELLNEWEVHFEKLKELDQRANDPDRYHNRGGQLLAEEKERKAAEKKIPKLESQLFASVHEYEQTNKKTFLVYGFTLRDFMAHIRENYELEKENMKQARKQAKDKSAKKTPLSTSKRTPCMSVLRVTPSSTRLMRTPVTNVSKATPAAKRKLPYDPSPNNASSLKKRVVTAEKPKATYVCNNKVRRSIRLNVSGKSKSTGKKKQQQQQKSKEDTLLSVSSYGNFQEHLVNRDELRSSILPDERAKTPRTMMKTPLKPVRRKVLAVSTPTPTNATRTLRTPRDLKLLATPNATRTLRTPRSLKVNEPQPITIDDSTPMEI